MPSQSEKHTLFQSIVAQIYFFNIIRHKELKNDTLWGRAYQSDSPYRAVPDPPPKPKTQKNAVYMPVKLLPDILWVMFGSFWL